MRPFPHAFGAAACSGALLVALLSGCSAAPGDPLAGAATATLTAAKRHHVTCAGDAAAARAAKTAVDYGSLAPGSDFSATLQGAGAHAVRLAAGTVRLRDFTRADGKVDAAVVGSPVTGLVGAGAKKTLIEVAPHTSTRKRVIPTEFPDTNPLNVLRISGSTDLLRSFTVQGTAQGHLYNGLRVSEVKHLRASYLRAVAIPGDDHQPPGETFGINDYRTTGSHWSHIVLDGKREAATGFGANGSKDIVLCDVVARGNSAGMGLAFWQTKNIRLVDCTASGSGFAGFNFERVSGKVTVIRPDTRGNHYGFRIANDRGSATFRVVDPKLHHGVFTVSMPRRWEYTTNKQRTRDITLVIHGKKRNDLLRYHWY